MPLNYLIQAVPSLHGEVTGDLTLGAQWALDLRTAGSSDAAPALEGMLRLARERGDLTVGADLPVVLGLRQFEARADVAAGALRVQVDLDGSRTGRARIDTTAQLLECVPTANLPREAMAREVAQALQFLAQHPQQLNALAQARAQTLLADHRRVREAARDVGQYSVAPCLPVDVMGVYVLLPDSL